MGPGRENGASRRVLDDVIKEEGDHLGSLRRCGSFYSDLAQAPPSPLILLPRCFFPLSFLPTLGPLMTLRDCFL